MGDGHTSHTHHRNIIIKHDKPIYHAHNLPNILIAVAVAPHSLMVKSTRAIRNKRQAERAALKAADIAPRRHAPVLIVAHLLGALLQ